MKGVYVGRFNPVHRGHERVIEKMEKECGKGNTLLVLGSSNAPVSLRHFFSYNERKGFLKKLFPEIPVIGMPDFGVDAEWLAALDDILLVAGFDPKEAVYYGGCEEDIRYFLDDGRKCRVLNRFESDDKLSATEVRDHLIQGRVEELEKALNPRIRKEVVALFTSKWEEFKKR